MNTSRFAYPLGLLAFVAGCVALPLEGPLANSIATVISACCIYALNKKISLLGTSIFFLSITFAAPLAILIAIGGGDLEESISLLISKIEVYSLAEMLFPSISGIFTIVILRKMAPRYAGS